VGGAKRHEAPEACASNSAPIKFPESIQPRADHLKASGAHLNSQRIADQGRIGCRRPSPNDSRWIEAQRWIRRGQSGMVDSGHSAGDTEGG